MPEGEPSKQDRDRRQTLLEAGLDLLIKSGGAAPSVKAICVRAGITRGAFYTIFDSRQHFLTDLFDWMLTDILGAALVRATKDTSDPHEAIVRFMTTLDPRPSPDTAGDIQAAYLAVMANLRRERSIEEHHARFMSAVIDRLEATIREGQDAGTFRSDVDARGVATILAFVTVTVILWNEADTGVDAVEMAESFLDLLQDPGKQPKGT